MQRGTEVVEKLKEMWKVEEKGQWIEFGARKLRQANKETGNEGINSNETGRQVVLEVDEGQAGRRYGGTIQN
ncbi:hypothetical protein WR25_04358 [Diploscapter pachys]|uniref:Uncharacterized protein n=1 Tax=Diploscapter pachys TaxID=2018661 RepID=A0A2A2LYT9_9BILA|nr:hypothetical protein WR25_04358 [Diploscapter pachys]